MHHQFTPDIYTDSQHEYGAHQNKMRSNRRYHSEQLVRNRAKVSPPSSYSLNSSIAYDDTPLTRVNYSAKQRVSLASTAPNRRSESSFDKYSTIGDMSSLYVRTTPSQIGTPSIDKYLSPYDIPQQNVRSASNSNFSLDAAGNNWSLLSNISKTPTRARACSVDSPQNINQLLSLHFSPCSCKNNAKRMSLASPVTSEPFASSMSASTPSLNCCPASSSQRQQSQGSVPERWQQSSSANEIPSPLNIYLQTRKRHARGSGYHCHTCK